MVTRCVWLERDVFVMTKKTRSQLAPCLMMVVFDDGGV
jgi:hypothetical protein